MQMDPNMVITTRTPNDDHSYDASSAGFTTGSTRAKLHQQKVLNTNLLKENQALAAQLAARDSDDDSGKTTKSTAQKLTEVLARLAVFEQDPDVTMESSTTVISPLNANLLKENQALAAQLAAQDLDDYSGKTTKSTAQKLTKVLAKLAVFENKADVTMQPRTTAQPRPTSQPRTTFISPEPQSRALAPDELSATVADSAGQQA
jgi:hypothetical protein